MSKMKVYSLFLLLIIIFPSCQEVKEEENAKAQLEATSQAIRAAFAAGDVDEIMKYHHPNVSKVFSYNDSPKSYDEVKKSLLDLTSNNDVSFGRRGRKLAYKWFNSYSPIQIYLERKGKRNG